jgi:hypothetical protein
VNLAARPDAGEGMAAGDVVNTTARLQSAAPVNGVLVGEATYRATRNAIDYREADPVEAKGKSRPIAVWEAVAARSRVMREAVSTAAPLVGRERELGLLRDLLVRVREESSPQLVTLVGVPGIGKSRLVHELMQVVEHGGVLTSWRRGRSLPYGEAVTLWALSEIVKAEAGIFESDSGEAAATKLHDAVERVVGPAEAGWVESHLRPLVGVDAAREAGGERSEAFAAWRRFFEGLAGQRPLVLVFEDLHWADDELLDFVDHLVDWAGRVPVLIVCTARPELLERRAGWAGGKLNATTLSLSPLSEDDTSRLLGALLERPVLPAETQQDLLARAGGNPLYAEQYAQLLLEGVESRELPVPESVQGIIAARLDRLPQHEKALLQDAAVVGKVFWLGGLLDGRSRVEVEGGLHALERKGFVQRARVSSVEGEPEYAFLHLLVRDVAYGQIPRAARAEKHRRTAAWIESRGRNEDQAETLAHHYLSALELVRASGAATGLEAELARRALRDAGDRAHTLYAFAAAARLYGQALELWPAEDPERGDVLARLGESLHLAEADGAVEVLEEAGAALAGAGDRSRAAEVEAVLAELWWLRGDNERCWAHVERAQELVRGDEELSASSARVLSTVSRYRMLRLEAEGAIAAGREAIEQAEALGLDEVAAAAWINVGAARSQRGDLGGIADLERGAELAAGIHSREALRGFNNLAVILEQQGDLRAAREAHRRACDLAEKLGGGPMLRFLRATDRWWAWNDGDWDESLRLADEFLAELELEEGASHVIEPNVRATRAFIRLARDDDDGALEDVLRGAEAARTSGADPDTLQVALTHLLRVQRETGRLAEAQLTARELLAESPLGRIYVALVELSFGADRLGLVSDTRDALDRFEPPSRWIDAARAVLDGEPAAAADTFSSIGSRP